MLSPTPSFRSSSAIPSAANRRAIYSSPTSVYIQQINYPTVQRLRRLLITPTRLLARSADALVNV
jgi:hypothetical protein